MELLKQGSNEAYGEVMFQSRPNTGRTLFWGIIILLPAVVFLVLFVIGILNPDFIFTDPQDVIERSMPIIFLGLGLLWLFFGGIYVKNQFSVDVFEYGIVVKRGNTLFEWDYSEIRGTAYLVKRPSILGLPIPLPLFTTRKLTIYYMGQELELWLDIGQLRLVNHSTFVDTVQKLFFKHKTAGVTRENINELDMYFGSKFHLTNGNLVISQGLANAISNQVIPFENITEVDLGFTRSTVDIRGINDKGNNARLFSTEAENMHNLDILAHLVAL